MRDSLRIGILYDLQRRRRPKTSPQNIALHYGNLWRFYSLVRVVQCGIGLFEKNALRNAPFQPHTWLRYIDDIFMIWTKSPENFKIFIAYLNNIQPTIKFTSSHSPTNVLFLDVHVSLTSDGNINTDLYTKPTDKYQHLLYSSCHPLHKKSHSF